MGLQIKIPNLSFTDVTLPTLYVEPMLINGSLFLIDPTHPYNPYIGIPVDSTFVIPNIAAPQALSLVTGSTTAGVRSIQMSGTKGKIERTLKGGIHAIISETTSGVTAFEVNLPDNIRDYMVANQNTHSFYTSLWHRITRAEPASTKRSFGAFTETDVKYLWSFDAQGDLPPVGAKQLGAHQTADGKSLGIAYRSIGVNGTTGGTIGATPDGKAVFRVGVNSNWAVGGSGAYASQVLYRAYIEDLTVSGRTYAQADAIDYALYIKEVASSGGRYYGDTFTDPVTLP